MLELNQMINLSVILFFLLQEVSHDSFHLVFDAIENEMVPFDNKEIFFFFKRKKSLGINNQKDTKLR